MTWNLQLGGHTDTAQDERTIIDKLESVLSDLGDAVHWHQFTTSFHGTGDVATVKANGTPEEPQVTPAESLETVPANSQPVTDAQAQQEGTQPASAPEAVPPAGEAAPADPTQPEQPA